MLTHIIFSKVFLLLMPDDCTLQVKHAVCLELKKKDKVCCNWWLIYYLLSKYHNGMAKISLQASFMV